MTHRHRITHALFCLLAACGGAQGATGNGALRHSGVAVTSSTTALPPAGVVESRRERNAPMAEAPTRAESIIGPAGAIVPNDARATLFLNSAVMCEHALGRHVMRITTGVLSGWRDFMPFEIVHPLRDLQWILLAGSLENGATQQDYFLAAYDFGESQADRVSGDMARRLITPPAKATRAARPDARAFTAIVDGALRAYIRPKAGVFAIVPAQDAQAASERLRSVDVPKNIASGELVRLDVKARALEKFGHRRDPNRIALPRGAIERGCRCARPNLRPSSC